MASEQETLAEAAYQTYLQAGGRFYGNPEVAYEELSVRHRVGWKEVAGLVLATVEGDAPVQIKALTQQLFDKFQTILQGAPVLFAEASREEMIAWEAATRHLCQLADADDDPIDPLNWSLWASQQLLKRETSEPVQDAPG